MNVLYTATAHATGDGRNGHARSEDGILDIDLRVPREMGGPGGAANPEMLFAAGYAACFHSALKVVASNAGYQVKGDVKINGQAASLDYRKQNDGDADIKLSATLDEASRARFGFDLGPAVISRVLAPLHDLAQPCDRVGR